MTSLIRRLQRALFPTMPGIERFIDILLLNSVAYDIQTQFILYQKNANVSSKK